MEDCGMECDEGAVIPVPTVTSETMMIILQWAEHHKNDPEPNPKDDSDPTKNDTISEWDMEFLKLDQSTLFKVILAANYLDIEKLLQLTCKAVANLMKGKSTEEIRETFKIENDLPPYVRVNKISEQDVFSDIPDEFD